MRINPLVQTDSYKISHSAMMPENMNLMFDYVEARKGGDFPEAVFFGLQMFIKDYLLTPFTQDDINNAEKMYSIHFGRDDVFDKEMFQYILNEYNGYFPVTIKAVPEGTVVPEGNVLCTFECPDPKCPTVVSFLEAKATSYIWYGTTVATNSYQMKKVIEEYGNITADNNNHVPFSLHDFGSRGCSPNAQTVGGAAHLVNFMGSDTLEGVFAAQEYYGVEDGLPGYSIPATEHSVMCSEGRDGEMKVAQRVFDRFAGEGKMIAMVNDTYSTETHIKDFSKIFKEKYLDTGVRWITRPDSGNPPEMVVKCLDILWNEFIDYCSWNDKKYKVLPDFVRVIQGDGIDIGMLNEVLIAVEAAGYSTENVAFGSGGGLLQKVNRDTLRFAMKASYIEVDGIGREVYKQPDTQTGDYNKESKKGRLSLYKVLETGTYFTTNPEKAFEEINEGETFVDMLELVYKDGKLIRDMTFDEVRANVQ